MDLDSLTMTEIIRLQDQLSQTLKRLSYGIRGTHDNHLQLFRVEVSLGCLKDARW